MFCTFIMVESMNKNATAKTPRIDVIQNAKRLSKSH